MSLLPAEINDEWVPLIEPESRIIVGHSHVLRHGVNQSFGTLKVDSYEDDWSGTDRFIDQLNGLLGLNNI